MKSYEEKMFYGEPTNLIDAAIQSANAAALRHLQKEGVVFIDDSNLEELVSCKRNLCQAKFWSDDFEARYDSCKEKMPTVGTQTMPLQHIVLAECQSAGLGGTSSAAKPSNGPASGKLGLIHVSARRALLFQDEASSST